MTSTSTPADCTTNLGLLSVLICGNNLRGVDSGNTQSCAWRVRLVDLFILKHLIDPFIFLVSKVGPGIREIVLVDEGITGVIL